MRIGRSVSCSLNLNIFVLITFTLLIFPVLADSKKSETKEPKDIIDIVDLPDSKNNPEGARNWIPKGKKRVHAEDNASALPEVPIKVQATKFKAEWTVTTIEYSFLIELTSEYYCERFGPLHVLCAYKNDRPGIVYYQRGVEQDKIEFILAYLIRLRKRLLLGKETGGVPSPLPRAIQICIMVWSEELQVVAQKIANQVVTSLNTTLIYSTDKFPRLTVTIALSKDTEDKPRWTFALGHWYKQVVLVPHNVTYFPSCGCQDYAAMVWGSTYQVGCGYVSVGGRKDTGVRVKIYVCVFGPGGNIGGHQIYITDPNELIKVITTQKPDKKDESTKCPITGPNPFDRPPMPIWETENGPQITTTMRPDKTTPTPPPSIITKPPIHPPTKAPPVTKAPTNKPVPPTTKPTTKKPVTKKPPPPPPKVTTVKPVSVDPPVIPVIPIIFDNTTKRFILQQPYMVLIVHEPLKGSPLPIFVCTGTIYNSQWIVTSYQCALPTILRQQGKPKYKVAIVYYGELILQIGPSSKYFRYVEKAVFPTEVNTEKIGLFDNLDASIVCLQLQKPVTFSKYTKVVKFAFDQVVYEAGEFGMFIGWKVTVSKTRIDVMMQKLKLIIQSSEVSTKVFSGFDPASRFSTNMTEESIGKTTCTHDNGGAMIRIVLVENHQAPVPVAEVLLLGILPVSFCQRVEAKKDHLVQLEYFTNVYKWTSWVKTVCGEQDMTWDF